MWIQCASRELARDQSAILIVFPASSVNALDAHLIRINSERFQIGATVLCPMRIITDSSVNTAYEFDALRTRL